MSASDPKILIVILNDLIDELLRWNLTASDTLTQMSGHQKQAQEKNERFWHQAGIVLNQATEDLRDVENATAEVDQVLSICHEAIDNAEQNLNQAQQQHKRAKSTLTYWQGELTAARAWLQRALDDLARAITQREAAQAALSSAQATLSSAQADLSRCESSGYRDKDGRYRQPNCTGHQVAVDSAQAAVARARQALTLALDEEERAGEEVTRAQARVNATQDAVIYSTQAASVAEIALERAHNTLDLAGRSFENAISAQRSVSLASKEAIASKGAADSMVVSVRASQDFTAQADYHFQNAHNQGDSAQKLATLVSLELQERVEHLIELNRPLQLF